MPSNILRHLLLSFFLLVFISNASAQSSAAIDSLKQHLRLYGVKKQGATLFVHFDKTVYTNNENVWFTAYIYKATDLNRYKTLALALIGDTDRAIILQEKFAIQNGNAFGNTFIPDSTRSGDYTFIAYSNSMLDGRIEVLFTQPVTIRSSYKAAESLTATGKLATTADILPQPPKISFYPESGSMVNDVESVIAWEAINEAGSAVAATAQLYKDDQLLRTVETDDYKQGKFTLKPHVGHSYFLKDNAGRIFKLPEVKAQGAVLSVEKAFVNDVLSVEVKNATGLNLTLLCHNYNNTFLASPVVAAGQSTVAINLSNIPKGLTQLTLVDSLGRPYAERSFFAHYQSKPEALINTDRQVYAPREKVNVKVKLLNPLDSATVSVAVVDATRIEAGKQRKIDNYIYLQQHFESVSPKPDYLANNADPRLLETMLLIKGWKRYTWADALRTTVKDTAQVYDEILFKGTVYRDNAFIKNPVKVINSNKPQFRMITSANGNFIPKDSDLVAPYGKKVGFMVDEKRPQYYRVLLLDPYLEINEKLRARFKPLPYSSSTPVDHLSVPSNFGTLLADVNIRTRKAKPVTTNICGDYVCRYDVLNCPNHRFEEDNVPAVKDRVYYIYGVQRPYEGCGGVSQNGLNAIYQAAEFYPADYDKKSPDSPEYISTLFWNYQLKVPSNTDATFTFFTSDITGKFRIIVQGTIRNDVTYGETVFEVKPDNKKVQ